MILYPTPGTEHLTASELRDMIQDQRLNICHKCNLHRDLVEETLYNMLYDIGPTVEQTPRKTLQILRLGTTPDDYPAIQVNIVCSNGEHVRSIISTECVCKHCPQYDCCDYSCW